MGVPKQWINKKRFKGQVFVGGYEFDKKGKRCYKLKNVVTSRETKPYTSHEVAKKDGWVKKN